MYVEVYSRIYLHVNFWTTSCKTALWHGRFPSGFSGVLRGFSLNAALISASHDSRCHSQVTWWRSWAVVCSLFPAALPNSVAVRRKRHILLKFYLDEAESMKCAIPKFLCIPLQDDRSNSWHIFNIFQTLSFFFFLISGCENALMVVDEEEIWLKLMLQVLSHHSWLLTRKQSYSEKLRMVFYQVHQVTSNQHSNTSDL